MIYVITPFHNAEETLIRACNSVLNNGFSDFILILVDDASTDESTKIAKDFAKRDARIKYLRLDTKSYPGIARNAALDICTHNANKNNRIVFLDADDRLRFGALASIAKHSEDIVVFDALIQKINTKGSYFARRSDLSAFALPKDALLKAYASLCTDSSVIFASFGARLLADIRFDSGIHEDVYFLYQALKEASSIAIEPSALYVKYIGHASITTTISPLHIACFFDALAKIERDGVVAKSALSSGAINLTAYKAIDIASSPKPLDKKLELLGVLYSSLEPFIALIDENKPSFATRNFLIYKEFVDMGGGGNLSKIFQSTAPQTTSRLAKAS